MEVITAVKGFKDILPEETGKWRFVENTAREIFSRFGFREIRLPIMEKTDLFKRGIGESTDIVEKEMYTFLDRGNEYLTLRPEATASVIRAYLEHALYNAETVTRLFTIGPMFRRERPQKGRFRQFHQIDVELLGLDDPRADAEVILMLMQFLNEVGLSNVSLELNSLGCAACRPTFRKAITEFLNGKEDGLCDDCKRRLVSNPLRVFDCKVKECQAVIIDAPRLSEFICSDCRSHFERVTSALKELDIPYEINTGMVRGLDYYTKTAFEVTTEHLGSQNAVAGGGRYDRLVRELGGPDIPGIGFAVGFERLISLLDKVDSSSAQPDIFVAALGEAAQKIAFILSNRLRLKGLHAEQDFSARSLKSQMKRANRLNCSYTLILGDREIEENKAEFRNMATGTQQTLPLDNLDEQILKLIKER
ncbi:MAG: Histidine--tRNA ligase [Syntrophus sp. PtaB.Bin001]|nr:MAG: Histidine--tRNA ligase [Syntrophus sp. PtaB.Bin001]